MICISMGYPDFESQINILKDRHTENPVDHIKSVLNHEEILAMQKEVSSIFISDPIYAYITHLAEATRSHASIHLGISPRGALAICQMSKAFAYISGRDFVVPEDVTAILSDVCAHRIVLSTQAKMSGTNAHKVIEEIIHDVQMPLIK